MNTQPRSSASGAGLGQPTGWVFTLSLLSLGCGALSPASSRAHIVTASETDECSKTLHELRAPSQTARAFGPQVSDLCLELALAYADNSPVSHQGPRTPEEATAELMWRSKHQQREASLPSQCRACTSTDRTAWHGIRALLAERVSLEVALPVYTEGDPSSTPLGRTVTHLSACAKNTTQNADAIAWQDYCRTKGNSWHAAYVEFQSRSAPGRPPGGPGWCWEPEPTPHQTRLEISDGLGSRIRSKDAHGGQSHAGPILLGFLEVRTSAPLFHAERTELKAAILQSTRQNHAVLVSDADRALTRLGSDPAWFGNRCAAPISAEEKLAIRYPKASIQKISATCPAGATCLLETAQGQATLSGDPTDVENWIQTFKDPQRLTRVPRRPTPDSLPIRGYGVDEDTLHAALQKQADAIARCAESSARRAFRVVLGFDESGRVEQAEALNVGQATSEEQRCVLHALQDLQGVSVNGWSPRRRATVLVESVPKTPPAQLSAVAPVMGRPQDGFGHTEHFPTLRDQRYGKRVNGVRARVRAMHHPVVEPLPPGAPKRSITRALSRCYAQSPTSKTNAVMTYEASLHLSRDGRVQRVTTDAPHSAFSSCMEAELGAVSFPCPAEGAQTVSVAACAFGDPP